MATLTSEEVGIVRDFARDKFWFFVQSMMSPDWYDASYHRPLCDFLQHGPKDKLIVLPRSHLKTTVAGGYYPLWRAIRNPGIRALVTSNSSPNAEKTVHTIRGMVEAHPFIQMCFPEIIPKFNKVRWSDRCACLNRPEDYPEGTFESAGVGANIVRRHFNLIIEDDTVSPKKDAMSGEESMPTMEDIEKAIGFHKLTIPLLVTYDEDERVVIGTRWASFDLINYIYENEVLAKGGRFAIYDKPAKDPETGIPLYKRFSPQALDSIRAGMGTYMFSALYLNTPLAKESMAFNPDWLRYFEDDETPPFERIVVTVDPADPPSGRSDQSYSVALAAGHSPKGIHVLGYFRKRTSDKELINAGIDLCIRWKSTKLRIETDRYEHMKYAFRDQIEARQKDIQAAGLPAIVVEGVKTKGKNKDARIMGLQAIVEARSLFLRRGMRELENEMFQFPYSRTKDILDALAWQLPSHRPPEGPPTPTVDEVHRYNKFSLETILRSVSHRVGAARYPFESQLGRSSGSRIRELTEQ